MQTTAIIRYVNNVGGITIPSEIRRLMSIREGDPMEVYLNHGNIVLKKHSVLGGLFDLAGPLCDSISNMAKLPVAITDRDKCVSVCGFPHGEPMDKRLSHQITETMESYRPFRSDADKAMCLFEDCDRWRVLAAVPVLSCGDILGCVVLATDKDTPAPDDVAFTLAQTAAEVLGRYTEE